LPFCFVIPEGDLLLVFAAATRSALDRWFSGAALPDSGGVSNAHRSSYVEDMCRTVIKASASPEGYCDSCGSAMVFSSSPPPQPSLGNCPSCDRQYNEGNIRHNFCTACGAPIEIEASFKERIAAHRTIMEIFAAVPKLKEYGYLSTHS
jgi:hypothetical protein